MTRLKCIARSLKALLAGVLCLALPALSLADEIPNTGNGTYSDGTNALTATSNTVKICLIPTVTSAATASGIKNTAFSYQIMATSTPTSYDAVNLPAWLNVDKTTGKLSGTPTVAGVWIVTVKATNACNGVGSKDATITILNGPNLVLTKTADVTQAKPGDKPVYTIAYNNGGDAPAKSVKITDALPAGATFVSATNGGIYDSATRTVTWAIGDVLAGASGQVQCTIQVN